MSEILNLEDQNNYKEKLLR